MKLNEIPILGEEPEEGDELRFTKYINSATGCLHTTTSKPDDFENVKRIQSDGMLFLAWDEGHEPEIYVGEAARKSK